MKFFKEEIEGVDVLFLRVGDTYHFFFERNGKCYTIYTNVTIKNPIDEEHFEVLRICAKESIEKLNESNITV